MILHMYVCVYIYIYIYIYVYTHRRLMLSCCGLHALCSIIPPSSAHGSRYTPRQRRRQEGTDSVRFVSVPDLSLEN